MKEESMSDFVLGLLSGIGLTAMAMALAYWLSK